MIDVPNAFDKEGVDALELSVEFPDLALNGLPIWNLVQSFENFDSFVSVRGAKSLVQTSLVLP